MSTPYRGTPGPLQARNSANGGGPETPLPSWAPFQTEREIPPVSSPWMGPPPPVPIFTPSGMLEHTNESLVPETPSRAPRKAAQTDEQKFDDILKGMRAAGMTLSKFLYMLFHVDDEPTTSEPPLKLPQRAPKEKPRHTRSSAHASMLASLLNGSSKPHFGVILNELWKSALITKHSKKDTTSSPGEMFDQENSSLAEVEHARVVLATWATKLVGNLAKEEGAVMTDRETGLHLRAQVKPGGRGSRMEEQISWDAVDRFHFTNVEDLARTNAPITTYVISAYIERPLVASARVVAVRYRPKSLVYTNAISSLTFARSNRANLVPMCRGLWMFATLASKTTYRVDSRLGLTVSEETVRRALETMSNQSQHTFRHMLDSGTRKHTWVVSDNVQTYSLKRDPRFGQPSQMVTGMAATAIEMDGVHPDAFNLETLLNRQANSRRESLTVDMIHDDIDGAHLENVAVFQFLQTLIHFVPALSKYRGPLKQFSIDHLQKVTRPKDFQSKVHPLRTNSCNEMNVQEMKEAVNDFAAQLGISEETINGRCWPFSGDGKTFDVLLRIRKLLSPEESTFESFRWMVPMLEIWHTKWTNMSGVVRDHYGDYTDPSSLASQAKTAGCPPIPNLRKVDFYEGQHLINVVLDANVLNCWEQYYDTTNLVNYFAECKDSANPGGDGDVENEVAAAPNETAEGMETPPTRVLPSFQDLVGTAKCLARRHASSQAFRSAGRDQSENPVPVGTPWIPPPRSPAKSTGSGSSSSSSSEESGESDISMKSTADPTEDAPSLISIPKPTPLEEPPTEPEKVRRSAERKTIDHSQR
ncbi:hypothetical protein DFP72DRAFT_843737 [Ephemerocybe angulata]|uniref:DUF6589 domain-containing protein n=1 Tax=Ephemerocybe angulata TaxID=980116 RepID=A0A8H6I7B8_9AGAR|nr:hypothetical protein DFP72DRAFT_843737 [Tulosesus angulatus]